jgi:hypothetical protein
MISRTVFILITLFWVTMNVLLWQTEFGSRRAGGGAVPAEVVWQKILTAPDSSSLNIIHRGRRIGFCCWVTSIGEAWANVSEENVPPEMAGKVSGYRLRLDGSAIVSELTNRVRFDGDLRISTNQIWQELNARLNFRPFAWEIRSAAAEQTLHLRVEDGTSHFEHVFKFSDLQNPSALLRGFLGPLANELPAEIGWLADSEKNSSLAMGVKWEARNDTLQIGHASVRVYRLQTQLLERYPITIIVSRVGEIFRVELPDELVLLNDQLGIL